MSIAKLLEQHRALVEEAGRGATFASVKAAQISRPIELQEQRVAVLKQRIELLAASKQDYVSRVDETIKGLREELAELERRNKVDRDGLAPLVDAIGTRNPNDPTRPNRSAKKAKAPARKTPKKG